MSGNEHNVVGAGGGGGGIPGPGGGVSINSPSEAIQEAMKTYPQLSAALLAEPRSYLIAPITTTSSSTTTSKTPPPTTSSPTCTTLKTLIKSPIHIKGFKTITALRPVAAKITHVKTTNIDTSSLMAGGTIKVATSGGPTSSLTGTPISINSQSTTSASIRAIGAGGQSTQVRVVMPTGIMPQSMIKQLEGATATGRTQITAIPAAMPPRTVSNASITVTRPVTQATYLPRAGVTGAQMTGMAAGQRLVTPLRATTSVTPTATGLTAAGSFVRGTTLNRSGVSQPSTVISSATNTAWMTSNSSGQVQLIRTIPQSRQRIITTQGITTAGAGGSLGGVSASGNVMTTTATPAQIAQAQPGNSVGSVQSSGHTQQQPQYVAVLPQRQHQATLVYSSNVPTSQPLSQSQFNTTMSTSQRFAVATPISGGPATSSSAATRQIRPIPIGKSFSTAKLNTTSISIRAPSIPQLTSTLATGAVVSSGSSTITATPTVVATPSRNTPGGVTGNVSAANMLTTANLPTTRIIQLQQPASGATQQIIGSAGRLATNVMLQPIIVNTSSGNKIGIRPPVTMTAKVQPSLTITQLGTIGKMSSGGSTSTSLTPQGMAASIQTISTNTGSGSTSIIGSVSGGSTITNTATGATQLVNVSQASQLLSAANVVSSASGTPGGATVVPLAITTRGGTASNILTGTITPIKNANGITVGKMMTPGSAGGLDASNVISAGAGNAPTSVFIHQRPGSNSSSSLTTGSGVSVSVSNTGSGPTPVVTSAAANAFLTAGSTIYYESMPANSVQVSTGVLSLTTSTVSQSTMSQAQMVNSVGGNLAISSLPFVTHAGGSTTTFTVVPTSAGGRTIGQLQLPVSNSGAQLQAVPVRLSTTQPVGVNTELTTTAQLLQTTPGGQQLIIPAGQGGGQQQQHMVIPLQTSVKVTTGVGNSAASGVSGAMPITSSLVSSFLRKRDAEGSPIRAAKNLAPTLLSMSSNSSINSASIIGVPSPAGSSLSSSSFSVNSVQMTNTSSNLNAEALMKKDRAAAVAAASTMSSRADSPASSDGSTTVSANSSPGVDQQIQDNNLVINRISTDRNNDNSATHFNPINELYSNHHHTTSLSQSIPNTPTSSRTAVTTVSLDQQQHQQQQLQANITNPTQLRMNGGPFDAMRKKSRRSTNDSQQSVHSHASLTLPPPTGSSLSGANLSTNAITTTSTDTYAQNGLLLTAAVTQADNAAVGGASGGSVGASGVDLNNSAQTNNHVNNNMTPVPGNKENAKPVEFVLRRPRNCTLMNSYKQNHKLANNHFLRYSDIKPRDDRRPSVMDLANQSHIMAKINGWKVYHLRSQMEDLVENEASFYRSMEDMLKKIEKEKEKNSEFERINELIMGNMQRSKIVADGVNDAQNQIMKIFDHKGHVADIITRCASKRNFKKREKI